MAGPEPVVLQPLKAVSASAKAEARLAEVYRPNGAVRSLEMTASGAGRPNEAT